MEWQQIKAFPVARAVRRGGTPRGTRRESARPAYGVTGRELSEVSPRRPSSPRGARFIDPGDPTSSGEWLLAGFFGAELARQGRRRSQDGPRRGTRSPRTDQDLAVKRSPETSRLSGPPCASS